MSLMIPEEEQALLNQNEERASSFKGTTFKVVVASIAAFAMVGIGAFMYPESAPAALSSFTNLSFWRAGEYSRRTRNNSNSRDIKYLDRHYVDCSTNYINQFKVSGSIRYSYHCMNGMHDQRRTTRYTPYKRGGNNKVNYLDRVDVRCNSDEVMNTFGMQTSGWFSRDYRYRYICSKPAVHRLVCSNKETPYNDYDTLVYLDRHNIDCPANEAVQRFKVHSRDFSVYNGRGRRCRSRHWWGGCRRYSYYNKYKNVNKIKYDYTCCSIDTHDPTPFPVARPTHVPISAPTDKPTEHPISEPTDHPITEPTFKPTEHPIAEPTFKPTINTKPLVCPVDDLKYASKKYTTDLPKGCAIVALDDLGWKNHKSTQGVLVCGTIDANGDRFEAMNLKSAGAAKTISYLYASEDMKITYFTEKHFQGASDTFKHGDEPIVHHKIVGADANDAIKSIKFVSTYNGPVPTECPNSPVSL